MKGNPSPNELPSTKKEMILPDSYIPKPFSAQSNINRDSRLGGRLNESFQPANPSTSTPRGPLDPDKSITENDDLHSLAELLAQNIEVKKQQQRENEGSKKTLEVAERMHKISVNNAANVKANLSKNELKLRNHIGEELLIDQEIEALKSEISRIDQRIDETKTSFLEDKSYLRENKPHVEMHKALKDGAMKVDVEIEKFRRAYDDLMNQWESGVNLENTGPSEGYQGFRNRYGRNYGEEYRLDRDQDRSRSYLDSSLNVSRDLNKSYTERYKEKTNYRGYTESYVKRVETPNRILPAEWTQSYSQSIPLYSPARITKESPIRIDSGYRATPLVPNNPA